VRTRQATTDGLRSLDTTPPVRRWTGNRDSSEGATRKHKYISVKSFNAPATYEGSMEGRVHVVE